jgi:hypothetical protein
MSDLPQLSQKEAIGKLKVSQIRFLQEYIKTGNMTQSWKKVYKSKSDYNACQAAMRFMKSHQEAKQAFLEMHGITDLAVANALKDGFNAKKSQIYKSKVYEFDDPYARMKAAELANKMLHPEEQVGKSVGNQLNVQINTEGGTFKVVEN